jgi:hypothetical protein
MSLNGAQWKQEIKFMMKTKSIVLAGAVLAAGSISPALMADTVTLYAWGPYSFGDGGEFTAVTSPTSPFVSDYSPYTSTSDSFQTFCVQTDVEFFNGGTYNYALSLASIGAGTGQPGTGFAPLGSPDSYSLSEGTAWLYSQFAQGLLSGYDFSDSLGQRQTDAGYLQTALWALQGGQSIAGYPSGTVDNPFYTDALTFLGANIGTAATASTDFGTEIMNLTDNNGNNFQNQLIYTGNTPPPGGNAPDNGTTLALLALSLAGLAGFSRRLGVAQRAQ